VGPHPFSTTFSEQLQFVNLFGFCCFKLFVSRADSTKPSCIQIAPLTAGANLMQLKQAVNELFSKDETNHLKLRLAWQQ
jgi:hypothetical protein